MNLMRYQTLLRSSKTCTDMIAVWIFCAMLFVPASNSYDIPSLGATCRMVDIGVIASDESLFGKMFVESFWNENPRVCEPNTDCLHYNLTEVTVKPRDILDENLNNRLYDTDYDLFVGSFSRGILEFALRSKIPYLVTTSVDLTLENRRESAAYSDDVINIVPFYDGISSALVHFIRTKGSRRIYLMYDINYIEEAQLVLKKLMKLSSISYTEQNALTSALTLPSSSVLISYIADRLIKIKADAVIFFLKPEFRWSSLYHLSSKFPENSRSPLWICGNSQALMTTPDSERSYLQKSSFPVIAFDLSEPSLLWKFDGNKRLSSVESKTAVAVLLPALSSFAVQNFTKLHLSQHLKKVTLPQSDIAGKIGFNNFGIRDTFAIRIIDATKLKQISEWNTEVGPSYASLIGVDPNTILKVAIVLDKPFAFTREGALPVGNGRFSGLVVDIFEKIVEFVKSKYNVRIHYHFIPTTTYGKQLTNGKWSGAIGQLSSGTADIAIGGILKTVDRSIAVDFTTGFTTDSLALLYRPKTMLRGLFFLLRPFHYYVWLLILASIWVGGMWIFILFKCDPMHHDVTHDKRLTMKQSLWYSVSTTFLFSQPFQPQMFSIKSFAALLMVFAFLLFVIYLSNLTALLSAPPTLQTRVRNLQDLLSQTYYNYGYIRDTATEELFVTSHEQTLSQLQRRISDVESTFSKSKMARDKVINEQFVCIGSAYKLGHIAGNFGNCSLRVVPTDIILGELAFALQSGLSHKTVIDESLNHLRSTGQIQDLIEYWFTYSNNCSTSGSGCDGEIPPASLTLTEIAGPCIILAAGVVISFICLAVKSIHTCHVRQKNNYTANGLQVRQRVDSYRKRQSNEGVQLKYISEENSIDLDAEIMTETTATTNERPVSIHEQSSAKPIAKF
ncbi:glutamate receptor-like [Tubulanus polymorphus]|uniref:glutamate receptor-like n=1 Tax=Tubulanus polymorphus TaxID=672921 RepID=UPI003DA1F9AF